MKMTELNYAEQIEINGGDRGCSIRDPRCRNAGRRDYDREKNDHRCRRDWGKIATGTGEIVVGAIGRVGAFESDGNENRAEFIRESTENLVKQGWHRMREGFRCKK